MSNHQLIEQGAILESVTASGTIPIRIIAEGKGSSAVYTRDFLKNNKDIFANRPMYMGHPEDMSEPWKRVPENIAGRTGQVVEYKEVDGIAGLYTDAKPRGKYRDLLEEFGDLFGVSIFTPTSNGSDGPDGSYIVESVDDSPLISVDFVSAAGAGGKVDVLIESLAALETKDSITSVDANNNKETQLMDEKLEKLISLFESFIADSKAKATEEVQAKVDAEAVSKSVAESLASYDAKVKLIDDADLLPSQRETLRESARRGEDVAPLIESAIKVKEEARSLVESHQGGGRVVTGGSDYDFSVERWTN